MGKGEEARPAGLQLFCRSLSISTNSLSSPFGLCAFAFFSFTHPIHLFHSHPLPFSRFYRPLDSTPSTKRISTAIADSSFSSLSAMRFPRFHVFVC